MKLLLIDGLNLVRRIYQANPAPDSPEKAAGALKSATSSFKRALQTHQPTHVFCGFDTAHPNWRHALYPQYREKRKPMPQPLRDVLPYFMDVLDSLNITHDSPLGFEAEDALAAYANRWCTATQGAPCVVLSNDKDLLVLLQVQGVAIYDHFSKEWRTAEWVAEKHHGISPAHFADWLALVGDEVDGVPGVFKVGAKTASGLLLEHGTLEGVLSAAQSIKGKLGERLREQADIARLSRKLVELRTEGDGLVRFSLPELAISQDSQT